MNTYATTIRCLFGARSGVAALVVGGMALLSAAPARAQIAPFGVDPLLISTGMRGSDVAYDPGHNLYLVVGAYGSVWGAFTDTAGNKVSSFTINTTGSFGQFPSVAYSPNTPNGVGGTGAFVVTWHENFPGSTTNYVNTRVVAYPAGPLGSQQTIVAPMGTWWESRPPIAYSSTSGVFLTVWRSADYVIWGARLDVNGTLIGSPFPISAPSSQSPSVAWNSATNEFAVLYTGFGSGTTTAVSMVTPAGTVAATNTFNFAGANGTYITDIAYNPTTGHLIGLWYQLKAGTLGVEIAGDGSIVATGLVSTTVGTYDGLGLAYNPVSGTFLVVGHGPSFNIWGAELNSRGARTSSDQEISFAGGPTGSFYPLAGANTGAAQWDVSFAHNFNQLLNQIVTTTSSGGGPAASLGSAPTSGGGSTPPPTTGGCLGTAPFPGAVCVNGGWVPGTTSGTSTGGTSTGGCAGTAPFPGAVCVNGGWVPGTTSGTSTGGTSTGGCAGTAPFPGAVCVNGGWVPGTTSPSTSCPGYPTAPFPGAVCVNGGWVPGSGGTSTGGGTSTPTSTSCPGTAPFPGAVCVNGGWVPGTTSTSTNCPGYPTPAFPGAVCVNGGWVPGGTSTSTTTTTDGTCTTPDPFTAIGGGICSNGGWRPKT
jgi:hypothetical protein